MIKIVKNILKLMQISKPKISIIMPVYNGEQYIEDSIKSILNQTLVDFELIIVNDGSTDNTKLICEQFARDDDRVILINQENRGAHHARNNGIKKARGSYYCFFDSDDYIDSRMLEDLYDIITDYKSDLVVCGFNINTYYNNDEYIVQKYIPYTHEKRIIDNVSSKEDFRKSAYLNFDRNMFYPPWNKMYSAKYINDNNIKFPITYRDDFPFVMEVIKDIQNVTYVRKPYYNFIRKRSDSETQKYVSNLYEKREEEHEAMLNLYRYWDLTNDEDSFEMISRRYVDRLIECMVNLFNSECKLTKSEKREEIKKYLSTDNFKNSIENARPRKVYLKLMYFILKTRSLSLCYYMCKFINHIKKRNVRLFANLKANR